MKRHIKNLLYVVGLYGFYTNKSGHGNACIASFVRGFNMNEGSVAAVQGTANLEENYKKINSELIKNVDMITVNYNYNKDVTVYNIIMNDNVKLPYYILMFSGTKFQYIYDNKIHNAEYRIYTSKELYHEESFDFFKLSFLKRVNYWFKV